MKLVVAKVSTSQTGNRWLIVFERFQEGIFEGTARVGVIKLHADAKEKDIPKPGADVTSMVKISDQPITYRPGHQQEGQPVPGVYKAVPA